MLLDIGKFDGQAFDSMTANYLFSIQKAHEASCFTVDNIYNIKNKGSRELFVKGCIERAAELRKKLNEIHGL